MNKHETLAQTCQELEDLQSWEDEQFMDALDQALGFNAAKQEDPLMEEVKHGPADWVKRMFDLEGLEGLS